MVADEALAVNAVRRLRSQPDHGFLHHVGLEVAAQDFEQERERLQSLGFEVRLGEHPFLPLRGLYIDDPDGNEVELIALT